MNKTKAAREGTLLDYLSVDKQIMVKSLQHLFTRISSKTMNQLVDMIGYQQDNITIIASQNNEQQNLFQPLKRNRNREGREEIRVLHKKKRKRI